MPDEIASNKFELFFAVVRSETKSYFWCSIHIVSRHIYAKRVMLSGYPEFGWTDLKRVSRNVFTINIVESSMFMVCFSSLSDTSVRSEL